MSNFSFGLKGLGSTDLKCIGCAAHLRDGDPTLFGQFLFGLLTGIRVGQVGVEVLVQYLCCLLVEVTPLTSDKQKKKRCK